MFGSRPCEAALFRAGRCVGLALRRAVATAQRKSELRRAEDPVDAVVCAYVALYAQRCPAQVTIYGDPDTGYIVTPSLPPGPVRPSRPQI